MQNRICFGPLVHVISILTSWGAFGQGFDLDLFVMSGYVRLGPQKSW